MYLCCKYNDIFSFFKVCLIHAPLLLSKSTVPFLHRTVGRIVAFRTSQTLVNITTRSTLFNRSKLFEDKSASSNREVNKLCFALYVLTCVILYSGVVEGETCG